MKIEDLNESLVKEVMEMKVGGKTYREITDYINSIPIVKDSGETFSYQQVVNFFERSTQKMVKAMKDNPEIQEKVTKNYFNTMNQLNKINEEIWGLYYDLKKDPELSEKEIKCDCGKRHKVKFKQYDTLLKISDQILKQITHADKILGNLKTGGIEINFNYNEMNNKILSVMPEILPKLEKQGIITINKKKFNKTFY